MELKENGMITKLMKCLLVVGILLPLLSSASLAQNTKLKKSVIGGGGWVGAKNSSGITMSGAVGQTAVDLKTKGGAGGQSINLWQGFWVPDAVLITDVKISDDYNSMLSNYPNPFNSATTIKYTLEIPSSVSIVIYDMIGNRVANIDEGYRGTGTHELQWEAKDGNGIDLGSGSYLYELNVRPAGVAGDGYESFSLRNVMVIVK